MKEKARFLTTLYVRRCLTDYSKWELTHALIYYSAVADRLIVVPSGTISDFASVPRIPFAYLLFANLAHEAAVIHDHVYQTGMVPRKMADSIFAEAMAVMDAQEIDMCRKLGAGRVKILAEHTIRPIKRFAMWLGVRIGGGMHYTPPQP